MMKPGMQRLLIALMIQLGGVIVLPLVSLPSRPFTWQNYSSVLAMKPATIDINQRYNRTGELLRIAGYGFQPHSSVPILMNGETITRARTNASGEFTLLLDTRRARPGYNTLIAAGLSSPSHRFVVTQLVAKMPTMNVGVSQCPQFCP